MVTPLFCELLDFAGLAPPGAGGLAGPPGAGGRADPLELFGSCSELFGVVRELFGVARELFGVAGELFGSCSGVVRS